MDKSITGKITLVLLLFLFCAVGILFWSTSFKKLPTFKYTQILNFRYIGLPKPKVMNKLNHGAKH